MGYPKNFADRCIEMYLHKVFTKHLYIRIMPKKELVCLDKNYNIFQTTRFNHTMIFFKLNDTNLVIFI